jgi:hypothetical protein
VSSIPQEQRERRSIASFETYAEAQTAVDFLSDRRFPVEHLTIVGEDLRTVEQVTGRLDWGRAALQGLLSGAMVGAFVGLLFGLFSIGDPVGSAFALLLWGAVIGAISGVVFGLLGYAMSGGRRDFTSVGGMQAGRYDLLADAEFADEATRILAQR